MAYDSQKELFIKQLMLRGIRDMNVIKAMSDVPREKFMPMGAEDYAYNDAPFPIGHGQTISQPYIVASMTEAARVFKDSKVLEIGTGSGYQAAILATLCKEVYTIEVIESLAEGAKKVFKELGYNNIHVRVGDGYEGWPEEAPFDAIVVTAAPQEVPTTLLDQLKIGGRLVAPIGDVVQILMRFTKERDDRIASEELMGVNFVPMVKS
ncbi:MAG: protein-L-isoaspartate O-methyltransferase [Candidatus Midichloriaceae bacterium]|jgi:protein-L-isoaspartate(D-aspartate) O-methyltransferase|nr:protein-L-isoaspartate O-methyltransferase [Candidatus Midichloriaceae bacterium]